MALKVKAVEKVKRVTSTSGEVEDPENENQNDSSSENGGGTYNGNGCGREFAVFPQLHTPFSLAMHLFLSVTTNQKQQKSLEIKNKFVSLHLYY
jgi:hypothetical protein